MVCGSAVGKCNRIALSCRRYNKSAIRLTSHIEVNEILRSKSKEKRAVMTEAVGKKRRPAKGKGGKVDQTKKERKSYRKQSNNK